MLTGAPTSTSPMVAAVPTASGFMPLLAGETRSTATEQLTTQGSTKPIPRSSAATPNDQLRLPLSGGSIVALRPEYSRSGA